MNQEYESEGKLTMSSADMGVASMSGRLRVASPPALLNVLGHNDEHLRILERAFVRSRILIRGDEITVEGPDATVVIQLFSELLAIADRGDAIEPQTLQRAIDMVEADASPRDVTDIELARSRSGKPVRPKTIGQRRYVEAIGANTITFGIGPAGTGKSYLAVALAVAALQEKRINRIILTRPAVEAGERLGFLPGDLNAKVDPYLRPLYDALYDLMDPETVTRLFERQVIEVAPLAFMRGRTLNSSFIILDEAQNTTSGQMKMFLTRIGFGSKAVVTGDVTQIDLTSGRSGLMDVERTLTGIDGVSFVRLDSRDVVRNPIVTAIVDAYDRSEAEASRS
ncbi:PhoH family protein [Ferrimicrobium acidiphilum]|uniref:PhoH-like protein n=2 Tax=Ferrimicrobium acidiphilum TaxID=121039 RepID=A0A0D8FRR5_9ACTN|nr:PhoH family protein [Ferrimicrobium acidiphilum]KJE75973.1 PhoH-like protein [Ferrimicrobium acidiphilum DSM 19497]